MSKLSRFIYFFADEEVNSAVAQGGTATFIAKAGEAIKSLFVNIDGDNLTEAAVIRTGKNLFGGTFLEGNKYFNVDRNEIASATTAPEYRASNYVYCKPWRGKKITLKHGPRGNTPGIGFFDDDKVYISGVKNNSQEAGTPRTYTVPNTATYLMFTTLADYVEECQIEFGEEATAYEAYKGETHTISWQSTAGAIDSGVLDVPYGKLTVGATEYNVTPVQIKTLEGINNIWSGAGTVRVRYDT